MNASRDVIEINVKNNRQRYSSEDEKYDKNESRKHLKMRNMNLSSFENIKEENEEYESGLDLEQSQPNHEGKGLSLMHKFDNPRDSASSADPRIGMELHSSSYDSTSNASHRFNNRHHSSNENL